ncbi:MULTISPECIES: 6-phospho-beta-glucosidase [Bacillaceae]|uniref:6-phospho-beta-glucosidase n=1 Tax=Caldibacillus thermoamylovorans TaxID=35841 RepID=A0ABD4A9Q4_9BACI|nr:MULTISPECIES: 6-phospho-beta-glucosidase [Bacillaceae]KIO71209.1 6-phospho-beta-glucosidase [Caldibacillus thermoamylovorans]KIO73581.1 6-phospho-beta-glucosidase [Caldibacillus thermoamylovorans]MDL0421611.1 6-phospho-beta-glucosidase [Caldibacillus thermoamylovorans]MEC5273227.1 6-phospho-beta-glucosidase [Caldifermentibacillus hisashii]
MINDGIKIVTIGGGSSYTPELVEGFITRYHELPIKELWLVDIEEGKEKLEIVGGLAKRMVEKANVPMKVFLTLDRREALKNADFVTTQLRVGLLDARIKDERIPLKYGMIGQETNGAGGLFKAFRTIPVMMDIVKDIQELCPNAWLVNFTNPAGLVTEAILNYSGYKKVIGVCNVPVNMKISIAKLLNVPVEAVDIKIAGLNHMSYGLDVFVNGESRLSEVIELLADTKIQMSMKNIVPLPWNPDFIRALGVIPSPYHRYYYKTKEILTAELSDYEKGRTRAEVVKELEEGLFEQYKNPNLNVKPPQLEKRGGAYYSNVACSLISSIYNDKKDIQILNVRNDGAISDLPEDAVVEVNCVVTKQGPIPLTVGRLPIAISGLIQQIKSFERVAIEAAITGSYEKALLALCIHPLITSEEVAKKILDELLEVHKPYLPQFFKSPC